MEKKRKIIIIAVVAVLVVLAGIGFWFWSKNKQTPSAPPPQTKEPPASTLGGKVFEKAQNPLKGQVPQTNPFKEQKNPLDVIYKNPFSQ